MPHTLKNIKMIFLAVFLIKFCILMIEVARTLFFTEEKMESSDLLKQFLKNMIKAKK